MRFVLRFLFLSAVLAVAGTSSARDSAPAAASDSPRGIQGLGLAGDETGRSTSAEVTVSGEAQSMFDLAAELFPTLLSNGSELRTFQEYIYRFFPDSGVYLGIKDGIVYVTGGPYGSSLKVGGAVSAVVSALQNIKISRDNADQGGGADISGLYDLTISGTISTVVMGIAGPPVAFDLTINDTVAPDPGDTGEITNVLTETLAGVSGVSDIEIIVTNNTESRVTFTVSFSATRSGVNVNMELEYDYVR